MTTVFFIIKLDSAALFFEISRHRDEYVMFKVAVPGERWEIELNINGTIEFEVFRSDGKMYDHIDLMRLIRNASEQS